MPESLTLLENVTLSELVAFVKSLSQNTRNNLPGTDVLLSLSECIDNIPDIPLSQSTNYLNTLQPDIKNKLPGLEDFPKLLDCMDLLPKKMAPTGRILKVTVYDFLNQEDPQKVEREKEQKANRSGICAGFLFALDKDATVSEHEHQDNGQPTDTIEIYDPQTEGLIDSSGETMTRKLCSFGQKHGIGPMPLHALVRTFKFDRARGLKLLDELGNPSKKNTTPPAQEDPSR